MKKKPLIFLISILSLSLLMTENRFMDFKPNDITSDYDDFTLKLSAEQDLFEEWNRTFSTSGYSYSSIALDSYENIYIAGGPWNECSLFKFDKAGKYQWNRTWNILESEVMGIAIDSSDNIYMVAGNARDLGNGIYLIKYNSYGDYQWYRTWDDSGMELPFSLAIDSLDNIYIVGSSYVNPGKMADVLLVKYNSSGDQQWNCTWGGNDREVSYDLALDSSDNIYLTGATESFGAGGEDMFLMKYNSSGELQFNYTFGSDNPTYPDRGYKIALDSSENIYIYGILEVDDSVKNAIVKFDHLGNYLWNKTNEYPSFDFYINLVIDSTDDLFLTQYVYLFKINSSGDFLWDTSLPRITGIAVDTDNNVFIIGKSTSGNFLSKYSSKPKIDINSPQIGEFFGETPPNFYITIYEPDVDTTWYSVDGGITNVTFTGIVGQIVQAEWDKLGHGTYNITFYANDLFGNEGFSKVEINKDITPPEFLVGEPKPNSIYLNNAPSYLIAVDDYFFYNSTIYNHLDSVWYTIDNGLTNFFISDSVNWVGTIDSNAWLNAPIGNITIRFYGSDDFGNIGFTEVIVEKRSESAIPVVPGYNLLIIAFMLSVIIVIILKKQKQK